MSWAEGFDGQKHLRHVLLVLQTFVWFLNIPHDLILVLHILAFFFSIFASGWIRLFHAMSYWSNRSISGRVPEMGECPDHALAPGSSSAKFSSSGMSMCFHHFIWFYMILYHFISFYIILPSCVFSTWTHDPAIAPRCDSPQASETHRFRCVWNTSRRFDDCQSHCSNPWPHSDLMLQYLPIRQRWRPFGWTVWWKISEEDLADFPVPFCKPLEDFLRWAENIEKSEKVSRIAGWFRMIFQKTRDSIASERLGEMGSTWWLVHYWHHSSRVGSAEAVRLRALGIAWAAREFRPCRTCA